MCTLRLRLVQVLGNSKGLNVDGTERFAALASMRCGGKARIVQTSKQGAQFSSEVREVNCCVAVYKVTQCGAHLRPCGDGQALDVR